jgi:hypothetical protein
MNDDKAAFGHFQTFIWAELDEALRSLMTTDPINEVLRHEKEVLALHLWTYCPRIKPDREPLLEMWSSTAVTYVDQWAIVYKLDIPSRD